MPDLTPERYSELDRRWVMIWAARLLEYQFPTLEVQKAEVGEFSSAWNSFVHFESARAADTIGYGPRPLAFINDVLNRGA